MLFGIVACTFSDNFSRNSCIREQGLEAQSFCKGGPPGFCCRLFLGGVGLQAKIHLYIAMQINFRHA